MARKPGQRDQISQDVTFGPSLSDLGINRKATLPVRNAAAALIIGLERRLGAMLRDMPMQHGARPADAGLHDATPTLADLGIERTASHRWQTMAGPETGGVRSRPDPPDALYGPCSAPFLTGG